MAFIRGGSNRPVKCHITGPLALVFFCVPSCGLCLMDFMIKQRPKRSYHVSSSSQIQNSFFLEFLSVENVYSIFAIFS